MKCLITGILLINAFVCKGQIYPEVADAISSHESNYRKSRLAKKHNNLFGFKSNSDLVIGKTKGGYSIYKSVEDSKLDYIAFEAKLIAKHNLDTVDKYLKYLSRRYAADPKWTKKIKQIIKYAKVHS